MFATASKAGEAQTVYLLQADMLVSGADMVDLPEPLQGVGRTSMFPVGIVQIVVVQQDTGRIDTVIQGDDKSLQLLSICRVDQATTNAIVIDGVLMVCGENLNTLHTKSIVPIMGTEFDTFAFSSLPGTAFPYTVAYLDRLYALTDTHVVFLEGQEWQVQTTWPGSTYEVTGLSASADGLIINTTKSLYRLTDRGEPLLYEQFGETDNMMGDAFGTAVAGNKRFAALVEDRVATATANLVRAAAKTLSHTDTSERDAGLALLGVGLSIAS